MYDPYTDNWKREVGMATADVLRALARAMPMLVTFYALCYVLGLMLSEPFEINCKSTMKPKHRAEAVRLLPEPKIAPPAMREPIKAEDE
jgi:hypothetical protein